MMYLTYAIKVVGDCRMVSSSSSGRFDWKGFNISSLSSSTVCTVVDVDVVLLLLDVVVPLVVVLEVVMVVVVVMVVMVVVVLTVVLVDFNLKARAVVCLEGRNVGLYFGVTENIVLNTGEYDQPGRVGGGRDVEVSGGTFRELKDSLKIGWEV